MRANRTIEIGTGLFVLLGFAALFFLTTQLPGSGLKLGGESGYRIEAEFDNVGDLKAGSPVSIAGVNVGKVESVRFDSQSFKAVVTMLIQQQFNQIPDDSWASIQTQGLLGGKYVGLDPGPSETYFKDGGHIPAGQTQSAIVLEKLINQFFSRIVSNNGSQSSDESPQGAPAGSASGQ